MLLLDEVLAVGDANFRAKCSRRLETLLENAAVILVSHYSHHIQKICNKALLLRNGKIVTRGRPGDVLATYAVTDLPANNTTFSILNDKVSEARNRQLLREDVPRRLPESPRSA